MVVLFELMIASILSMEQVLDCKISLYSPPQAGYGTSSVAPVHEVKLNCWNLLHVGKSAPLSQATRRLVDSRNLFFRLDGSQEDRMCDIPCTRC